MGDVLACRLDEHGILCFRRPVYFPFLIKSSLLSTLNGAGSILSFTNSSYQLQREESSDTYTKLGIIVTLEGEETFWRSFQLVLPNNARFLRPPVGPLLLRLCSQAGAEQQLEIRCRHPSEDLGVDYTTVCDVPDIAVHAHLQHVEMCHSQPLSSWMTSGHHVHPISRIGFERWSSKRWYQGRSYKSV